jgi:hypothetical protein
MISYVLVMIVSLASGQITHAFVEGPMSDSWCEQLIQQQGYSGQTGATLRAANCLRWPDAQLELAQSSCRQTSGPGFHTRRQFECAVPEEAPSPSTRADAAASVLAVGRMAAAASVPAVARRAAAEPAPAPERATMPTRAALTDASLSTPLPPSPPQGVAPSAIDVPESPAPLGEVPASQSKRFHVGTAAESLVTQAHTQVRAGSYELAEQTIERALRIEPDNPLLWVELARVWMSEGDPVQADGTSRRALALAEGDRQVQASAWRLIAESLRARARNQEAVAADRQAIALAAQ